MENIYKRLILLVHTYVYALYNHEDKFTWRIDYELYSAHLSILHLFVMHPVSLLPA